MWSVGDRCARHLPKPPSMTAALWGSNGPNCWHLLTPNHILSLHLTPHLVDEISLWSKDLRDKNHISFPDLKPTNVYLCYCGNSMWILQKQKVWRYFFPVKWEGWYEKYENSQKGKLVPGGRTRSAISAASDPRQSAAESQGKTKTTVNPAATHTFEKRVMRRSWLFWQKNWRKIWPKMA